MRKRSINISDESELELAWSKKSSSYFEHNFPLFLLSCILNTSIKMRNILHWVNFLVKKIFPIFSVVPSGGAGNIWIYFIPQLFSITANKFYLLWEFLHYYHYWMMLLLILLMMRLFSVFSWSWIHITLIHSHHPCNRHGSRITLICMTATVLKTCWNS